MLTAFILKMLKRLWKTNDPLTMTRLLMLVASAIAIGGMIRGSANHRQRACVARAREVDHIDCVLCILPCLGFHPDSGMAENASSGRVGHGNRNGAGTDTHQSNTLTAEPSGTSISARPSMVPSSRSWEQRSWCERSRMWRSRRHFGGRFLKTVRADGPFDSESASRSWAPSAAL
jgi:hypothetical protein